MQPWERAGRGPGTRGHHTTHADATHDDIHTRTPPHDDDDDDALPFPTPLGSLWNVGQKRFDAAHQHLVGDLAVLAQIVKGVVSVLPPGLRHFCASFHVQQVAQVGARHSRVLTHEDQGVVSEIVLR